MYFDVDKEFIQGLALEFYTQKSDSTLIRLFQILKPELHRYLSGFVEDYQTREIIIGKTFMSAWDLIEVYDPKSDFLDWLYLIAKDEFLRFYDNSFESKNSLVSKSETVDQQQKLLKVTKEKNESSVVQNYTSRELLKIFLEYLLILIVLPGVLTFGYYLLNEIIDFNHWYSIFSLICFCTLLGILILKFLGPKKKT